VTRDLVLKVHQAMQDAPHDSQGYRQARAAIACIQAEIVRAIKAEHLEDPQNEEDQAYDAGLDDAVKAVEGLDK
jgi:hypothetical protein